MNQTDALQPEPDALPKDGPPTLPTQLEPVSAGERVLIVDVLRGFALLGILLVNMQFYTTPLAMMQSPQHYWPEWYNQLASFLVGVFAEGKFYILFSFLFGLGIAIQLLRAEERGKPFARTHARRMGILFLIGMIHAYFIWMGDILTAYAVMGFVFLLFLKRKPGTLLIWAAAAYILPIVLYIFAGGGLTLIQAVLPSVNQEIVKAMEKSADKQRLVAEEARAVYAHGTYWEVTALRAREVVSTYPVLLVIMGSSVFTMFLLGMWTGKQRLFANLADHLPTLRKWRWPALAVGLICNVAFASAGKLLTPTTLGPAVLLITVGLSLGAPALTFFYVSTIVLLYQRESLRPGLEFLAPVGQMALTNYLAQSVICTTIFYSHGLGLYASVGPAAGLGLTLCIFLVEVIWSYLWLRILGFRFGPMEWLWRSLTYGQVQPIR